MPADERSYLMGKRAAWTAILQEAQRHLGADSDQAQLAAYQVEREETLAALRDVCEEFGDLDWEDDLNLSDIIRKHLLPHLLEMGTYD